MTYSIEQLARMSEQEIWNIDGPVVHIVDHTKAKLQTTKRRTILSWYFWELYRKYPFTDLTIDDHVGNSPIKQGFELKANKLFFKLFDAHVSKSYENRHVIWEMAETMYEICNTLHNVSCAKLTRYASNSDLGDICELINHPTVIKARELMKETHDFDTGYKMIIDELSRRTPELRRNGIAKMIRAGLLNNKQVVQVIGARGFTFSTDNNVYRLPLTASYADGFHNNYDSFVESRSASRSYYMTDKPLKDSEYLNRRIQLLTGSIREVAMEDCGTTRGLTWKVAKGDASAISMKYAILPNGETTLLTPENLADLVDTVITIRSITACKSPDPTNVCHKCLGYSGYLFPKDTCVGFFLSTDSLSEIGQLMMGTKHAETSQGAVTLTLAGEAGRWLTLGVHNQSHVYLSKEHKLNNIVIRVALDEGIGINSYLASPTRLDIDPSRVTTLSRITIATCDDDGNLTSGEMPINLLVEGTESCLSATALADLYKSKAVKIDGESMVLTFLNFHGKHLFTTPPKSINVTTFQKTIEHFIMSGTSPSITDYSTPTQAVIELKRLFDQRMSLHITNIEVFVRACMTKRGDYGDYQLPVGDEEFTFMPAGKILENRSISAAMAYEYQQKVLTNPLTYTVHDRLRHSLDQVLIGKAPG